MYVKENHKQNKKTTHRIEENTCKWCNRQGLNSKICKQFVHLYIKTKTKQPNQKMGRRFSRYFSKEDIQMTKNHMKRCSTLLIIREMPIKTILKYHLTQFRIVIMKKFTNTKCWRGFGEKGTLLHCWWECKLVQPLWKIVCVP